MKIKNNDNHILVSSETTDFAVFLKEFKQKHTNFIGKNLIIELSENINASEKDIFVFLDYAQQFQENGTSFVVVFKNVDVDSFPETFNIAPTLQEARDVIEMEDIQRDLGF